MKKIGIFDATLACANGELIDGLRMSVAGKMLNYKMRKETAEKIKNGPVK